MTTPAVTPQIQGLPPGAILKPMPQASSDTSGIEGLPPGAILRPVGGNQGADGTQSPTKQPTVWETLTQDPEKTDNEFMGYTGPAGVAGATIHGLNDVGRGVQSALGGAWNTIRHPLDTARSLAQVPSQVAGIPEAIRNINAAPGDPSMRYLQVAQDTASQGAGQALTALAAAGVPKVFRGVMDQMPAAKIARAGQAFNNVKAAVGDVPVDVNAPGSTAFDIQRLANSGGSMPKVVRNFLQRVTAPGTNPLTYNEARDFYSNASRLSADEQMRLTPVMKRQVGQFTSQLGKSIGDVPEQVGMGDQYQGAMKDYASAMNMKDRLTQLKKLGVDAGIKAAGGGAVLYGVKKLLSK